MDKTTRALIVDDYDNMLRILRGFLKRIDIVDVTEASNGEAALDLIQKRSFDLVISDWNMAPMNGIELLRAVRREPHLKNLPFIIVTAANEESQILEAKQAGVSNYIVKPFDAATLHRKVKAVMKKG